MIGFFETGGRLSLDHLRCHLSPHARLCALYQQQICWRGQRESDRNKKQGRRGLLRQVDYLLLCVCLYSQFYCCKCMAWHGIILLRQPFDFTVWLLLVGLGGRSAALYSILDLILELIDRCHPHFCSKAYLSICNQLLRGTI